MSGEMGTRDAVQDLVYKQIAHSHNMSGSCSPFLLNQVKGFCHTNDVRGVVGAGSEAELLASTSNLRNYPGRLLLIQCANTFWPIKLVCPDRYQVSIQSLRIQREVGSCLNSIGVKWNSHFLADLADLRNWVDGTDFVIGKDNRYKRGISANHISDIFRRYHSKPVHR